MRIIKKKTLLSNVAERFREEYQFSDGTWYRDNWAKVIYETLCNLSETATEDDIIDILGGNSWVLIECSECHQSISKAIDFGYGDQAIMLCLDCLNKAIRLSTKE